MKAEALLSVRALMLIIESCDPAKGRLTDNVVLIQEFLLL